jgi:hypothetical protein
MNDRDAGDRADKSGKGEHPAPFKRRSFLAARQDEALEAETLRIRREIADVFPSERPSEDDDIPVLTEIVPASDEARDIDEEAPPDPPANPEVDPEEITKQMVEAIERQLAYELPTLIEASLLNISADLRSGIASTTQTALREFVAQRKQP